MTFIISEIVFAIYLMIGAYVARKVGNAPKLDWQEWLLIVMIWPFALKEIRRRRKDADRLKPFQDYLDQLEPWPTDDEIIDKRLRDVTGNMLWSCKKCWRGWHANEIGSCPHCGATKFYVIGEQV